MIGDVVIRQVSGRWYVCHAGSYQNAIGSGLNGTATRNEAVKLAESFGFRVVHHETDQLQRLT